MPTKREKLRHELNEKLPYLQGTPEGKRLILIKLLDTISSNLCITKLNDYSFEDLGKVLRSNLRCLMEADLIYQNLLIDKSKEDDNG